MSKIINQTFAFPDGFVLDFRDDQARAMISGQFSEDESYEQNDIVIYDNDLYQFYSAHKGPWTGTDARVINLGDITLSPDNIEEIMQSNTATSEDIKALFV